MRILVVAGSFAGPGSNPWLTDDLVAELADRGHSVDVIVASATRPRPRGRQPHASPRVKVWSTGVTRPPRKGRIGKLLSYALTAVRTHLGSGAFLDAKGYDLCIFTSLGAFTFGLPARLRRRSIARILLFVLWDFFPIHQIEIGRIRRASLHKPLKWIERRSFNRADLIAVMSPANERFLEGYHKGLDADVLVVPPWASTHAAVDVAPEAQGRLRVIFGGQLVAGRGVDVILEAAALLRKWDVQAEILVAGDGPLLKSLREAAAALGLDNTQFLGVLPRDEYRTLLKSASVGIAITVPGVSVPTFPSKIVEYCAAGVPVVACIEAASDAGDLLSINGAGMVVPAGDPEALAAALQRFESERLAGNLEKWSASALHLFHTKLSVASAVDRIEDAVGPRGDAGLARAPRVRVSLRGRNR